jgi:hypothetical protein
MGAGSRVVTPELLDALQPDDPLARRSRGDLRRVHRVMRSVSILREAMRRLRLAAPPRRILELGAGDASLLLRLARANDPLWRDVSLTILDRHDLVTAVTRAAFEALGWRLTVLQEDALGWAAKSDLPRFDLCVTSLFLHHFEGAALSTLMRAIARNADALIALEPRRDFLAAVGSRLIGLLGAGRVTRDDAVKSVAAGFRAQELTALWPKSDAAWWCEENAAAPFAHCFIAARERVRHA